MHQTCDEVHEHLRQVREVCDELGLGMLGLGFDPKWRREDISWMPKARYRIMRDYMPKKGRLGLDMMLRTCTVQTNLDYQSEADMVKKFRVSLALQPVAVALFANSPFVEGKPSGLLSQRSQIWTDTDPDRCGTLPFVFEPGFGFERYVDYMLDVPMYFVYRDGRYIDASGQSFRDFLAGRLPALPGRNPAPGRLDRPSDDGFPRGAAEDVSRDARRRWRPVAAAVRAAGAVGRASLRHDGARCRLRIWSPTGPPRSARRCAATCRGWHWRRRCAPAPCATWRSKCSTSPAKGCIAAPGAAPSARTKPIFSIRCSRSPAPAARPAEELLEDFRTRWHGEIDPVFTDYAY